MLFGRYLHRVDLSRSAWSVLLCPPATAGALASAQALCACLRTRHRARKGLDRRPDAATLRTAERQSLNGVEEDEELWNSLH